MQWVVAANMTGFLFLTSMILSLEIISRQAASQSLVQQFSASDMPVKIILKSFIGSEIGTCTFFDVIISKFLRVGLCKKVLDYKLFCRSVSVPKDQCLPSIWWYLGGVEGTRSCCSSFLDSLNWIFHLELGSLVLWIHLWYAIVVRNFCIAHLIQPWPGPVASLYKTQ